MTENQQPGQQLTLIDDDAVLLASETARHIHTGEQLRKTNPEKYQEVCSMLAEGCSYRQVARMCRCSRNLVAAVAQSGTVEPHKQRIASKLRLVTEICTERILERVTDDNAVKDISLRDLSITLGVAADKSQVLSGGASQIVQVDISDPGRDDYQAMLAGHKTIDITDAVSIGLPRTGAEQKEDDQTPGSEQDRHENGAQQTATDGACADTLSDVSGNNANYLHGVRVVDGVQDGTAPGKLTPPAQFPDASTASE